MVRVDELDASGNVARTLATFTRADGPMRQRVRVHLPNGSPDPDDTDGDADPAGYYYARWFTNHERLSLAAVYRARVLVREAGGALRELGYADVDVVRNQQEFRTVNVREYAPLIDGHVLRINPTAESHEEHGNMVRIRVRPDEPLKNPRPGATVTGKVQCGRAPWLWCKLHEAWEWLETSPVWF